MLFPKEGVRDYLLFKLILLPKLIACAIMIATIANTVNVTIIFLPFFSLIVILILIRPSSSVLFLLLTMQRYKKHTVCANSYAKKHIFGLFS